MARGFFAGLLGGGVVGVGGVAVMSLLVPLPAPPDAAVDAPGAAPVASPGEDTGLDAAGRDADLVELAPVGPGSGEAEPDDLASLQDADTQPGPLPEVGGATGALEEPGEQASPDPVASGSDAPVAVPSVDLPSVPDADTELSISTEPAQPAAPTIPTESSAFDAPVVDDAAPEISTAADATLDTGSVSVAADPTGTDAEPNAGTESAPSVVIAALPDGGSTAPGDGASPSIAPTVDATPQSPAPSVAPVAPERADPAPAPSTQPAAPPVPAEGESTELVPTIGKRVVPLTERNTAQITENAVAPAGPPPIEAFAAPFDAADGKPMMAILLIDGPDSLGAEALAEFPYPLTFAVDPSDPAATEKMQAHRDAGFEVVVLADLPLSATAQDAEVILARSFELIPESVGLLEGINTGVQGNRALSDQVTAILKDGGRGLVTQDSGFNTVQKLAQRSGVPAAVVFRDFDGAGQTPRVMRRFLDQAAFRAGQEGAVIMMGRLQPDTVSALLVWGLQDRVSRVALAPVSAVLTKGPE